MARPSAAIVNLKLRIKEWLREKIEIAAEENGHSMNNEMAERIEKSFATESKNKQLFDEIMTLKYGPKLSEVVQILAEVFETAGLEKHHEIYKQPTHGKWRGDWLSDSNSFQHARVSLNAALDKLAPHDVSIVRAARPSGNGCRIRLHRSS